MATEIHGEEEERLTPLETEVLAEYRRLLSNLNELSNQLQELASNPSTAISEGMRVLERKTALVHTALKASVYGIVLQQQMEFGEDVQTDSDGGDGR